MDPERPVRIAHVNFSLGTGGLETGLVHLVARLPRAEFQHGLFTVKGLGPNAGRALAAGAHVEQVGSAEGRNRTIIWKLMRRFRWFKPDIVHTRNFGAMDAIIAARLAGVRAVVHGEHGYDRDDPDGSLRRRRLIRVCLSPMVTRFVTVSQELNTWLGAHRGIRPSKVQTIHNGVDLDRFAMAAAAGIDRGGPAVIGTVARLTPIKDQATLVRAFGLLAQRYPGLRLRLVGDGPSRGDLAEAARSAACEDRVDFPGESSRVEDHYRDFRVFALTSRNEGISNTILEAMACARPVVATAVGGNPELVEDGRTGLLVPPGDVEALAAALERYVADPELARAHGLAGRERARERFSIPRMIGDYRRLYYEVLRRTRPDGVEDPGGGAS